MVNQITNIEEYNNIEDVIAHQKRMFDQIKQVQDENDTTMNDI